MGRGGARVNSGPPPDPNALRRDRREDKAGWTLLPAAGRQGDVPEWPLGAHIGLATKLELLETEREMLGVQIDAGVAPRGAVAKVAKLDQAVAELRARVEAATAMEVGLWATLWATPQAVAWEQLRWTREVALYVRWQVQAELGDLDAGKEARQWSDRLGLNPTALLRNRWKIVDQATPAPATPRAARARSSSKARLEVVQGGKSGATSTRHKGTADDGGLA